MLHRFISDVHLGNHQLGGGVRDHGLNFRARCIMRALYELVPLDNATVTTKLHIVGDLFDTDKPSPQLIDAAAAMLSTYVSAGVTQAGLTRKHSVQLTAGNHDATTYLMHALTSLRHIPGVSVDPQPPPMANPRRPERITGPHFFGNMEPAVLSVPFRALPAEDYIEADIAALRGLRPNTKIATIHAGVKDGTEPPWLADATDAIHVDTLAAIARKHGLELIVAGNWHNPQKWVRDGVHIVQCGAFVPTGWDNPGWDYGRSIDWVGGVTAQVRTRIIAGPRFFTVRHLNEVAALAEQFLDESTRALGDFTLFLRCVNMETASVTTVFDATLPGLWTSANQGKRPMHIVEVHTTERDVAPPSNAELRDEVRRLRGAEDMPELVDEYLKEKVPAEYREEVRLLVAKELGL